MLSDVIDERNVTLVVIDSLGEVFGIEGINEDRDNEVGPWMRAVPRNLAEHGPAVILIDHSTKANDNPLYPSGSKRKRAAITGASYLAEATTPFVKAKDTKAGGGRLRLTCAKDRHGNYRRGEVAAQLVMECPFEDVMRLTLWAPSTDAHTDTAAGILAARAAVKAANKEGRQVSLRGLVDLMKIKASRDTKIAGMELAVARGALTEQPGSRGARLFTYATELPETPDD
jgi:hypothetical protein